MASEAIKAAKLRLASVATSVATASQSLSAAKSQVAMAKQMLQSAETQMKTAQNQVDASEKEMKDAKEYLKSVEKKWQVIDVDLDISSDSDGEEATDNKKGSAKKKSNVSSGASSGSTAKTKSNGSHEWGGGLGRFSLSNQSKTKSNGSHEWGGGLGRFSLSNREKTKSNGSPKLGSELGRFSQEMKEKKTGSATNKENNIDHGSSGITGSMRGSGLGEFARKRRVDDNDSSIAGPAKKRTSSQGGPWLSSQIEICVKSLQGNKASNHTKLTVKRSDTIKSVKDKVRVRTGTTLDQYNLCFGGRQLEDDKTLNEYGINNGSFLDVSLRSNQMTIRVKTLTQNVDTELDVRSSDSVFDVKCRISIKDRIERERQKLIFGGSVLDDDKKLSFYNIQDQSLLHLVLRNPDKKILFYVETLTGKKITINASISDTVKDIKDMISKTEGVPNNQQRLIFGGKVLLDDETLLDCSIRRESTLHLVKSNRTKQI